VSPPFLRSGMRVESMRAKAHVIPMDGFISNRVALPIAVAGIFLFTFVVPAVRSRRRDGTWGFVLFRRADPLQALIGAAMAVCVLGVAGGAGLVAALGPEALGVWEVPAPVAGLGWVLVALGGCVTVLAQRQMGRSWRVGIDDRPTPLVTEGLF